MYNAKDPNQQRMMMHWSNTRPMKLYGKGGNISKDNRLPTRHEAEMVERWAWPPGVTEDQLKD